MFDVAGWSRGGGGNFEYQYLLPMTDDDSFDDDPRCSFRMPMDLRRLLLALLLPTIAATAMSPSLKLTYFNIEGAAEPV